MATLNGASTLPKVLDAYAALMAPGDEWNLIVIDNGSTDDTCQVLQRYLDRLPLHYLHEPRRGKNAALNTGVAFALQHFSSGLLVFSDDDAAPEQDWLVRLSECAAAQPSYAVFGGAIFPDWAAPPPDWLLRLVPLGLSFGLTAASQKEGPVHPGLVWGANMAIRRAVFDAGHRFNETLGPNGGDYAMGSEIELTRKLHRLGHLSWFCPAAQVRHHIRAHQLTRQYVLQRAWRFGRGKRRQEQPGVFPELFGIPRWMLIRYLLEMARYAAAVLRNRAEQRFLHQWEMTQLRGYFHEARSFMRHDGGPVLIISYSGELGGMELRMAQEARFLAADGHRSVLALRRFPGLDEWSGRLAKDDVVVSMLEVPPVFEQWRWRRLNRLRAQVLAARRMRAYRASLVHVAMCWTSYGLTALWLAAHCGLPAVISVHNSFACEGFSPWHEPLLRRAFNAVRGVYAVSGSAMERFLKIFRVYLPPSARLSVIPNAVDTLRFVPSQAWRAATRTALRIAPDALVIGSVGRLSPQKRPELLIDLLALLSKQFPELVLVLAGGGPLEQQLRERAQRHGLAGRIVFAGFLPHTEHLYPALDLHLLMSRNEGFGIATIEAMACGVPAIATEVPGSLDILRGCEGGQLVPANDLPVAAAIVAKLLHDPERRRQMSSAARACAETAYSQVVVGQQVRAFYDGLL
jgi:glycosyltransferase involved in cell wall biosynthesis